LKQYYSNTKPFFFNTYIAFSGLFSEVSSGEIYATLILIKL